MRFVVEWRIATKAVGIIVINSRINYTGEI